MIPSVGIDLASEGDGIGSAVACTFDAPLVPGTHVKLALRKNVLLILRTSVSYRESFLKVPSVSEVGSSAFRLNLVGYCADLTENGCRPSLVDAQFCRLNPDSCPLVKVREVFGSSVVETLLFGLSLRVLFPEVYYHLWSKHIFTRWQISFSSPAHKALCGAG